MKIKYELATETVEVEVSEHDANIIVELDCQEYNINRKETRRHCFPDAFNLYDAQNEYIVIFRLNDTSVCPLFAFRTQ